MDKTQNQNQDATEDQKKDQGQQNDEEEGPVYHDINQGLGEEEEGQKEEPAV